MSASRARGGLTPSRLAAGIAWTLALAALPVSAAWMAGQLCRDRWAWSQLLFWIPPWSVALASGVAFVAMRRCALPHRGARLCTVALGAGALLASARFLLTEIGWSWRGAVPDGAVTVTHWNPQWPGKAALESGRALAPELGDVAVITSPGSMLLSAVRDEWLPGGSVGRDLGAVAVVTRGRILDARMLGSRAIGPKQIIWAAWFDVALDGGRVRILAVDLPSSPELPRAAVAGHLAELLAAVPPPAPPDVVLGDFNSTPGSVVFDAAPIADFRAAPPWRSAGWLGTYPRPWAPLRIDAMLASPGVAWISYRTVDLRTGKHRAQQGVFVPASGR